MNMSVRAEAISDPIQLEVPIKDAAAEYIRAFRSLGVFKYSTRYVVETFSSKLLDETYEIIDAVTSKLPDPYAKLLAQEGGELPVTGQVTQTTYDFAVKCIGTASYLKPEELPPLNSEPFDGIRDDVVLQLLRDAAAYAQLAYETLGPGQRPHTPPENKRGWPKSLPIRNICATTPEKAVKDIRDNPEFDVVWRNKQFSGWISLEKRAGL